MSSISKLLASRNHQKSDVYAHYIHSFRNVSDSSESLINSQFSSVGFHSFTASMFARIPRFQEECTVIDRPTVAHANSAATQVLVPEIPAPWYGLNTSQ